jgi:hypothetical protein
MTLQTIDDQCAGPDFEEFEEAILQDFLYEWRKTPQKISSLCPELITQCRIHLIHLEAWFRHIPHEPLVILATLADSTSNMVDQWKHALVSYPQYQNIQMIRLGEEGSLENISKRLSTPDMRTVVVINFNDFPKIRQALIGKGLLPKIAPWTSYIAFDKLLVSDRTYPIFVSIAEKEIIFLQIIISALVLLLIGNRVHED